MRVTQLTCLTAIVLGATLALACGQTAPTSAAPGTQDAGSDVATTDSASPPAVEAAVADSEAPALPYPAKGPADPPQVVTQGGPVVKKPKIIPVFFTSDTDKATQGSVVDFVNKIGTTDFWKAITTEYGVGAATGETPIMLTAADNPPATLDDSVIQLWLAAKLNANDPAWPAPDANTIYALFYPAETTITLGGSPPVDGGVPDAGEPDAAMPMFGGGVEQSCTFFGGYHNDMQLDPTHNSMNVAYAVLPRCPGYNGMTALQTLTSAASHEFLEASTDPFPEVVPAYSDVDNPHFYWSSFLGGGEIGDMCAQFPSSFTTFAEMPYQVQRSWSNKAATAGQDPCVPPLPGEVYFNTVPVMDKVPATYAGGTVTASGVQIAAGASKTIELDLFSTGPTSGPWTVSAIDQAGMRMQTPQLTFAFDKTSGQNGDKIQMTITVVAANKRNRESFIVSSVLGAVTNIWLGMVVN